MQVREQIGSGGARVVAGVLLGVALATSAEAQVPTFLYALEEGRVLPSRPKYEDSDLEELAWTVQDFLAHMDHLYGAAIPDLDVLKPNAMSNVPGSFQTGSLDWGEGDREGYLRAANFSFLGKEIHLYQKAFDQSNRMAPVEAIGLQGCDLKWLRGVLMAYRAFRDGRVSWHAFRVTAALLGRIATERSEKVVAYALDSFVDGLRRGDLNFVDFTQDEWTWPMDSDREQLIRKFKAFPVEVATHEFDIGYWYRNWTGRAYAHQALVLLGQEVGERVIALGETTELAAPMGEAPVDPYTLFGQGDE